MRSPTVVAVARPLRICFPGAVYHLMSRGNARQRIVLDDEDRRAFLRSLAQAISRYGWLCHAFCLMDNHYHLALETPNANLPVGMRHLNGVYAQRFNERYARSGHVFEARYRSILVEKETHFLSVCRYVVLNPVRAGITMDPAEYAWSSYRATAGLEEPEEWLFTDWVLAQFGGTRRAAQVRYRDFVADGIDETLPVRGERVGTQPFLADRFDCELPLAEIPRIQVEPVAPALADIFRRFPDAPVATAYRRHGYRLHEIAAYLGCHYSTVSRRLRREEDAA